MPAGLFDDDQVVILIDDIQGDGLAGGLGLAGRPGWKS